MTAARRGQKAASPQLRRPPSRNFPSGAVRPTLSHASTIPASAPSVPPDMRLNAERESDRPRCHPPHMASSGTRSGFTRVQPASRRSLLFPPFGQPQDDIAVILAGSAQRLELVNVGLLDIDDEAASRVSLRRRLVCALRKARFDCGVGGRGDGDADHRTHATTTEWLRPETSISSTPTGTVLARQPAALTGHRPRSRRVLPLGFIDERPRPAELFCGRHG